MTPEPTLLWERVVAEMVLAHKLGGFRAERISSPFLHCCGLRTRDINIIQKLGVTQNLRPQSRHAESEYVL